jgi:hypothetical protein
MEKARHERALGLRAHDLDYLDELSAKNLTRDPPARC